MRNRPNTFDEDVSQHLITRGKLFAQPAEGA